MYQLNYAHQAENEIINIDNSIQPPRGYRQTTVTINPAAVTGVKFRNFNLTFYNTFSQNIDIGSTGWMQSTTSIKQNDDLLELRIFTVRLHNFG